MRRPAEQFSQERLVLELKLALDRDDLNEVMDLIVHNPHGVRSRHVQRDIGVRRARILNSLMGGS